MGQAGRLEASLAGEARKDALAVEYALENDLKSFGKGFTVLEKACPPTLACLLLRHEFVLLFARHRWECPVIVAARVHEATPSGTCAGTL